MPIMQLLMAGAGAPPIIEYLVIAGGGARTFAGNTCGGGGAGGYRCSVLGELSGANSSAEAVLPYIAGSTYVVTVGAGGTPGANNGQDSSFGASITSKGGGYGSGGAGNIGGCGGGGGVGNPAGAGGLGTANQGFQGGPGTTPGEWYCSFIPEAPECQNRHGGGGGGAGGAGLSGDTGTPNGGNGIASSITGSSVFRAGGGAPNGFTGGLGSSGANTGGGSSGNNLSGESGIVIIRYASSYAPATTTGSPTVTVSGGYRIYQFTGVGSITF